MILTGKQILEGKIVSDVIDATLQEQSCGVDLTISKIETYMSAGVIDFDNSKREKPRMSEISFIDGECDLNPGAYLVTFNETVSVPIDKVGIAMPRSTMLRCGATMETSIWDPGYVGKSQSMLVVYNRQGIRLCENARIMQIMFMDVGQVAEAYSGIYNGEGLKQ